MLSKSFHFKKIFRARVEPAILNRVVTEVVVSPKILNYASQIEASAASIAADKDVHQVYGVG